MKKVKTIVTSLLIFFATAFMSACSCGGQDPVDQVYETGITIRCLSENITNTLDEESGLLTISCHRGDEFVLEYTLTPASATTTQVDWEFNKDGIVDSRTYTRSQSTIESITFNARSKGEVDLTFTTKATGKKAYAKITVFDAKVALPTFASPENVTYDPNKAEISWDQVTKVITSQGVIQDATMAGTSVLGLTGYEVSLTDLSDNTTTTTLVTNNKLGGLERGKSYSVVVKAIGDGFNVKTGDISVPFKYHQIATATDLANNKGNITFVSPNNAKVNRVYYVEGDKSKFISPSTTSGATSNVNYKQFSNYEMYDEFVVSVQSFPDSAKYDATLGYAVGDDGIRYYPSVVTDSITIQKLKMPSLSLVNNKQDLTIDGVTFTSENPDEKPNVSSMISWHLGGKVYSSIYGVKFAYQLVKNGQSGDTIVTNDTYFDLKGLSAGEYTLKACTVGNDNNTIPSAEVTISLTVLDTIKNVYVAGGTTAEWNIVDNVLNINPEYKIDGVELYFVNKNSSVNSQKLYFPAYDNVNGYNIPRIDISKLGLTAGAYDIYGRYVGVISDNGATMSATSVVNDSTDKISISVVDPVTTTKIASDGNITFSNVSAATSYDFMVKQTRNSNPVTITVYTSSSSGVPANAVYASDVVNGERTISFYDIVRKIVATVQGITEEEVESLINSYVHSDYTMSYQIIAKGNGSDTIDATATKEVKFGRLKNITNISYSHTIDGNGNINENTNILAFSPVANATRYVIGIDRYAAGGSETRITNIVSQPIVGYTNSQTGKVEIDITNVQISGSEDTFGKYIARLVNNYDATSISFSIRAVGSNGNTTTQGNLDTVTSVVPYGVTTTPTELSVNKDGLLTWNATNTQNEQYLVKFYFVNGETYTEITDKTYRFILNSAMAIEEYVEGDTVDGEGEEDGDEEPEPEPEPEPINPFYVDINAVLAEYEGQTIAISIEELNASRINGNASSKYFSIQLPKVVADYSTNGTTPVISWDAVDGADYYDIEVNSLLLVEPIKVNNITATYYAIPDDWNFDVYSISVVAKKTNSGANSATNPYVLYSTPTTKQVTIASAIINAWAEGTNVVWGDIGLGTEYKFEYKLTSASTYIEVDPSVITRDTIDTTKLMFDASDLTAGVYSFKVTPSVDFTDKSGMAYIIRGTVQDNTITRLEPADTLATENGNITFQVYADPTIETLLPELYIEGEGGNYNKISSDEYILTHEAISLGGDSSCLKYTLILNNSASGNLKFKVKVVASGYLDSILSSELSANKLSAIEDLTKEGNWLSWSNQADVSEYLISFGQNAETLSELRIYIEGNETSGFKGIVDTIVEGSTVRQELTTDKFKYENGKFYYLFDEVEFIGYGAGAYSFTIKPITNKANAISGSVSAPVTITKLNNEAVISIENGEITISPYAQLEGVTETPTLVSITIKAYTIKTEQVETGTGEGGQTTEEVQTKEYVGEYSSDIQFVADETIRLNLSDIALTSAGTYEVTVKYIGNGNLVLDSIEAFKDGLEKLQTTTLGTVEGEITWGAIDTAEKYAIKVVQSDGTEEIISDITVGETGAVLPKDAYTFELGKTYTLHIQAQGSNYINSEWSDGFYVRKLQAPTNLQLQAERNVVTGENGETTYVGEPFVKWSDPNGTKHKLNYVLTFNNENVEDIIIYSPSSTDAILTYQVLDKTLPIGIYLLQLRVLGNTTTGTGNTGLLSSDFGTGINATYIQDVTDVVVKNGVIRWGEINGAYAYKVSAYIKSEYDSDPVSAEAQFSTFVTETNYNQNTGSYEYTFSETNIADLNSYYGNYTIVVNAYTDPSKAIVSTNAEIEQANKTNLYKPQIVDNYKVKDGMLSWTMSIANIKDFVDAQVDAEGNTLLNIETTSAPEEGSSTVVQLNPTLVVLQYIVDKINLGKDGDDTLDEQLSFIYKIQLKVNGAVVTDIADSVTVYKGATIVNDKSKYADATTLEFTYDVAIDPEEMEVEDYIPEIPEENPEENPEGGENEGTEPMEPNAPEVANTLSTSANSESSVENLASWYTIQIASVGNSNTAVPVINSGYTTELKAYKPMTPRSWIKDGNDIVNGNVLWELVTTEKSTTEVADYYKDYRVTAISNELGKAYFDVTINNDNIKDEYKYFEHLKNMFVTENGSTNFVHYNNFYTIMINTIGTKDSSLLSADETIYLNSNPFKFANPANILSHASAIKVENSELTWSTSYGSTATKLFIYGPFDNLQADGVTYNEDWRTAVNLENETPRIITLADEAGVRESKYTLTDMLYNNDTYEPGAYIIKTQEIGDGKGVVDSVISNDSMDSELRVIKLGKTTPTRVQSDTDPHHWLGYSDDKAGMFVWNAVPLANAYKVSIWRGAEKDGQYEFIAEEIVTDTYYDLPSGDNLNVGYYYIEISACHVEDDMQLSPNYFTGDKVMTTSHERVNVPTNLVVKDDGIIYWNDGTQYTNIGHYEVMYNANPSNAQVVKDANGLSQDIPEMDLNLGTTKGTIAIQVRGIAVVGNGYLNSSFSPQVVITKLADPNPRVENGVFMWGTEGDGISEGSVTPTEITIDGGAKQVLDNMTTSLTYYTELETYDSTYRANQDTAMNKYPTGAHQFKVMFQGTSGSTLSNNGEFYLASNKLTFNATKLATPVLENVVLEVNGDADNRVTWSTISGAIDYKVIVFAGENERQDFYLSNAEHESYFDEIKDGQDIIGYYFKLNDIIASFESSVDGITLHIHCQALGTVNSAEADEGDTIYLNSSYSNVSTITVPPMPTELRYIADEGRLAWTVGSESAFNIMLNVNYQMENVTAEEFDNYWKLSADAIGENNGAVATNPDKSIVTYSEIKYRKIVYTIVSEGIYHLEVTDTIMLLAEDGITPTSYTLTSVGYNYSFGVTATIGNETYDGVFKSVTNNLNENNTFDLFEKGDGSSYLPYQINNQSRLNKIRYFTDRHFEIISDITLENLKDENHADKGYTWDMITGTFSGSIDGNSHTIKNITTQIVNINSATCVAFMENNSGTIKDLNLEINYTNSVLSASKLNVSGLAITNNGTISGVTISGYKVTESSSAGTISITAGNVSSGTGVGGLVITNNATIENSTVSINITALDNGGYSTYAGGIAVTNNGTISGSNYTGTITSNYLGGITASNYGTIDKCSVTGTLNSTDRPASTGINTRKGSIAGGITAEMYNGTTISNSYSTAKITITKDSSTGKTTYVGGIVGDLASGAISTIKNCYVVVDFDYLTNITDNSVIANYVVERGINSGSYTGAINNYYMIASTNEITVSSSITGITLATDLDNLKSHLSTLKDDDENYVYNTTGEGYPTLN